MTSRKIFLFLAIFLAGNLSLSQAEDTTSAEYLTDSLFDRILSANQAWGEMGVDASAAATREAAAKLRVGDKEYAHGLGHHANGEIVVELGGEFKTFETEIGIQWQGGKTPASAIFRIFVDDKKAFESGVMHENDPAKPISVSVEGAKQLRLVVSDAGDGIHSDCADWLNARLIRNPAVAKRLGESAVDIAPFGKISTWNPKETGGTKANRVQEMPAEDIFTAKELLPTERGTYLVPLESNIGCIGLRWDENRFLRRLELQFAETAAMPSANSIKMEYWTGESAWQGTWQPVNVEPVKNENRLTWKLRSQDISRGTQKVRWLFADAKQPIELKKLSALTWSRWSTIGVRLEPAQPQSSKKVEIEIYNGVFEDQTGKSSQRCEWDLSKPLSLKVRYCVPERYKADRTVLRFQFPKSAFGIAVEDLLANDCVYVAHAGVFAAREPAPTTLAEYLKKISTQKTVLDQVRERPDQDFKHAWSVIHHPVQDTGPMLLSLANDNRKFVVGREGGLSFDAYDQPDDPRGAFKDTIYTIKFDTPWQCRPTFGEGKNLDLARHLQGDWLPIPVNSVAEGSVVYRQTTYVAPMSEATADAPSWFRERTLCAAEFQAKNGGNQSAPAKIALNISHAQNKAFSLQEVKEGVLVVQGDRVLALFDTRKASPLSVKRVADGLVLSGDLPAGAASKCVAVFPAWKVEAKDYAVLLANDEMTAKVESYWKSLLEPATQIDVPDAFLNNLIRASQVHCMLAARNEEHGRLIAAWTASAIYGPLESESNAIIRGMDMNGQSDFARRSLEFFLKRAGQEGFITTGYTLVGTGEVLWTLAEHYDRTRDRQWLKKVAPEIVRVCQWVMRQREKTKKLDARGQKIPEYGLMPPGVSADWNRFAFRLFNDTQFYAGLKGAGKILAEIGDPAAPAILEDARQYREDIVRAYHSIQARSPVVRLDNGVWVPGDPAFMDCFGKIEDFLPNEDVGRTWAYGIEVGAHHLAAVEAIDPNSEETEWMNDYLEDVQFLRTGMGDYAEENNRKDVFCFGGFGKVQPYYGRSGEIYAMRDEVKPYIRSYFNTIPTLTNPEILSIWEHFNLCGAWNKTHETGWFLCQTRIMLVNERGDDLWLAPFVTDQWMKDGQKIAVRNAPTNFGNVSYKIDSKVAQGTIEAAIELPEQFSAKHIVLRLRHPEGKPIKSVTVQGKEYKDFDPKKDTITLPSTGRNISVRANY